MPNIFASDCRALQRFHVPTGQSNSVAAAEAHSALIVVKKMIGQIETREIVRRIGHSTNLILCCIAF